MKYISEIPMQNGISASNLFYKPGCQFTVVVSDMCGGESALVDSSKVDGRKIIGVAPTGYSREHVILRHDVKSVALYQHIALVRGNLDLLSCVDYTSADMLDIGADGVVKKKLLGYKDLIIRLLQVPAVRGLHGSVASLSYVFAGKVDYYTLYDFIALFCEKSGVNLMKYDSVYISCRGDDAVQIRFKHTVEANRFFTKMWLDIVR